MATLLVATTGGHLAQMVDIVERLPDDDDDKMRVWVTHENAQSRSLLADEHVVYVPYVGAKDVAGVARNVATAHRLHKEWHFTRAVSTGSAIALGYLPYCATRGVSTHYIESATRMGHPSLTARALRPIPRVHMYTQYPGNANKAWHYGGSVFDGYAAVPAGGDGVVRRAVVTLGTAQEFPFRRMLDALVPLLRPDGALEHKQGLPVEVLWQTGCTDTAGLDIDAHPFVAAAELDDALARADLVVSHAGTGSALSTLRAGRMPLLVPRAVEHGELGDDHQDRFARDLERRGLARRVAPDEIMLDDLLTAAVKHIHRAATPPPFELVS